MKGKSFALMLSAVLSTAAFADDNNPLHASVRTLITTPEVIEGMTNDGDGNLYVPARAASGDCPVYRVPIENPTRTIVGTIPGPCSPSGLAFGPDGKLYVGTGDGQQPQRNPQDLASLGGKVLRMNLDGSIPDDNPELDGVKSHVWTYGHRNAQGIDFGPDGTLYASEQGPKTDDEVNALVAGGNYGWPRVVGFKDDMAYQYARWDLATTPCEQLTFSDITIDPSVPVEDETAWEAGLNNRVRLRDLADPGWFYGPAKARRRRG